MPHASSQSTRPPQASPIEPSIESPQGRSPASSPAGLIYCAGYRLGDIGLFHGIPFLSRDGQQWIGIRSDDESGAESETSPPWHNQRQPWPTFSSFINPSHLDVTKLLPLPLVERFLANYFKSPFSEAFPIVDRVLFPKIIERAYTQQGSSPESATSKACIFAFLAFSSLNGYDADPGLPPLHEQQCITAAQLLIPDLFTARPSAEVVDALLMFAIYNFGCGNVHAVDLMLSAVVRFLFMLGAHLYPGEEMDSLPPEALSLEKRKALHLRDDFWICYVLDKEITFRTGRPPIINDSSCDLTFPKYYWKQSDRNFKGVYRLPGDLRLSTIKSNAYERLYSPQALRKADAEILKDIRELDEMLENWRLSLPLERRPTLSAAQPPNKSTETNGDGSFDFDISTFLLKLEYHHCMTTIHQASSRCTNWVYNHRIDDGLSSSLDLALASSRAMLTYFSSVHDHLFPNIFWVAVFYPLSAILTLFCNIMLSPASASAASDLKILEWNIDFMSERNSKDFLLSVAQLTHLDRLKQSCVELLRLARTSVLQSQGGA
ncbi:hypothetical protein PV08_03028 [Exophiala spinifera]|uniref:Xylanolytic transcriptional activator regulatory domain-containing protein n=1 Tax=Exophiala spinifera TaxID=91928 RepID=A0A0D2C562_9EURO|nr:uncharacterized protein PV08_03028 [Exophiala spinifera]KIW18739.1 hypothetical protein PV08_03028 [Exophiala spinifera]